MSNTNDVPSLLWAVTTTLSLEYASSQSNDVFVELTLMLVTVLERGNNSKLSNFKFVVLLPAAAKTIANCCQKLAFLVEVKRISASKWVPSQYGFVIYSFGLDAEEISPFGKRV